MPIKGALFALVTDQASILFYEYHARTGIVLRDEIVFPSPLIEIEAVTLSTDAQWLLVATSSAVSTLSEATRPSVHIYKVRASAAALIDCGRWISLVQ